MPSSSSAAVAAKHADVGAKIKARRIAVGMTQSQLARRLNVTGAAVCIWEHGRQLPAARTRGPLCDALKISPSEIGLPADGHPVEEFPIDLRRAPAPRESAPPRSLDVPVVDFGKARERIDLGTLVLDTAFLRDMGVKPDALLYAMTVWSDELVAGLRSGDRVVVDGGVTRVVAPGLYVWWNGISASLGHITLAVNGSGSATLKVNSGGTVSEVSPDHLSLLGKVVLRLGRS